MIMNKPMATIMKMILLYLFISILLLDLFSTFHTSNRIYSLRLTLGSNLVRSIISEFTTFYHFQKFPLL